MPASFKWLAPSGCAAPRSHLCATTSIPHWPGNWANGTDHGAANLMFLAGKPVQGGHYGEPPSLANLAEGDNLGATVDFRRVYATAIDGWLKRGRAATVLKGDFETLPIFG